MKVKSESEFAQSCPTRRDPMDCSLPGSSVHGIFQARGVSLSTPLKYGPVTQSRALLKKLWVTQRSVAVVLAWTLCSVQ